MEADLIFHSGTVLTVDREFTLAESAAVRDGRVVATGTTDEIRSLSGRSTRAVDLAGGTPIPGINDSHLHLQEYAINRASRSLDLSGVASLDEARSLIATHQASLPACLQAPGCEAMAGTRPDCEASVHWALPPRTSTTSPVDAPRCSSTSACMVRG